ncbi:hypothetical protein BGZ93_006137 [Podila epicladia]|nr:hypothetical protein BGZ93_006137 [Podila epicladia]
MFDTAGPIMGRLSSDRAVEVMLSILVFLPYATQVKIRFNVAMFYSKLIKEGFLVDVPNFVPMAVLKACGGIPESDTHRSILSSTFGLRPSHPPELRPTPTPTSTATEKSGFNSLLQSQEEVKGEIMNLYNTTKTHKNEEHSKTRPGSTVFQAPAFNNKANVVDFGLRVDGTVVNRDSDPFTLFYTEPRIEEPRRKDAPEESPHKDSGEQLPVNAEEERKKEEELFRAILEEERKRNEELLLQSIAEERSKAKQQEELYRKAIEQASLKTKAIEEQLRKELAEEQRKKAALEEQVRKDLMGAGSAYQFNMDAYLKEQRLIQQGLLNQYIKEQSEQHKALTENIFKDQQAQSKVYQEQVAQILQAVSGSLAPNIPNLPPWLQALHEEDIRNRQKYYTDLMKNTTEAGASDAIANLCNSVMGLDLGASSSSTSSSQSFASPPSIAACYAVAYSNIEPSQLATLQFPHPIQFCPISTSDIRTNPNVPGAT